LKTRALAQKRNNNEYGSLAASSGARGFGTKVPRREVLFDPGLKPGVIVCILTKSLEIEVDYLVIFKYF
jgi:hypothetical protein